jgi:hypothetical protein
VNAIKAIPTLYRGTQFRSRLEARWAIFFDLCRIPWEYEPVKINTGYGNYIPDFRIGLGESTEKSFVEIKGIAPTESQFERLEVASEDQGAGFLIFGSISDYKLRAASCSWMRNKDLIFQQCPFCGSIWPNHQGMVIHEHPCQKTASVAEVLNVAIDFTDWDTVFPKLPHSPIIETALDVAARIPFEQNFAERLDREAALINKLWDCGAFCDSSVLAEIFKCFITLKLESDPPEFPSMYGDYWRRFYTPVGIPAWKIQKEPK